MVDTQTNAVSPSGVTSRKPRQGRSPAFPFIPLNKAIERAETFRVAEGGRPKHFSPLVSACKAWGIGVKTGPGIQTVAALGHYGLFEFEGSGEKRAARLTDLAFRILLDKQPLSPERDELIRRAALTPRIHAELWKNWPDGLPSNATLETYLVRDREFSESGARDLIVQYRETIAFAKLGQPANIPPDTEVNGSDKKPPPGNQDIEVGDLIQAEIDGVFAFEKPTRVRAIQEHEGHVWAFVDGSEAGILMKQAILEQKGKGEANPGITPPRLPEDRSPPLPAARREVFALDEGDVVLTFPENLSAASYEDLEAYLQLFLRKAKRRVLAGQT
jgi:hypothetical protein